MQVFLGTLIIVALCCLAMGLGLILTGKPLAGGCGKQPAGGPGCGACPKRTGNHDCHRHAEGQAEGEAPC